VLADQPGGHPLLLLLLPTDADRSTDRMISPSISRRATPLFISGLTFFSYAQSRLVRQLCAAL